MERPSLHSCIRIQTETFDRYSLSKDHPLKVRLAYVEAYDAALSGGSSSIAAYCEMMRHLQFEPQIVSRRLPTFQTVVRWHREWRSAGLQQFSRQSLTHRLVPRSSARDEERDVARTAARRVRTTWTFDPETRTVHLDNSMEHFMVASALVGLGCKVEFHPRRPSGR